MTGETEQPATAEQWAAAQFEPVKFTPPSREELQRRVDGQHFVLTLMAAILSRDADELVANCRQAPEESVRFMEHLGTLAAELRHDADLVETAQVRLLAALTRLEQEDAL